MQSTPLAETTYAITGAAGALGRHLVRHLLEARGAHIRALVHRTALPADLAGPRVVQCPGSLLDRDALDRWLVPGCTAIHLAFASGMSHDEHRRGAANLAGACAAAAVHSLVHCSTVAVAGRTPARVVTEDTPCEPATPYARAKYEVEQMLAREAGARVPLIIARPATILGPGLRTLVALADALSAGRGAANFARASLFGRRQLHLVPVDTVVRALRFLASANAAGETFLISIDDEPGGDFRSVEDRLRRALGARRRALPPLPVPSAMLRLALAAAGRSDRDPQRIYDGAKLRRAGFVPAVPLADAIDEFAAWYLHRAGAGASAQVPA